MPDYASNVRAFCYEMLPLMKTILRAVVALLAFCHFGAKRSGAKQVLEWIAEQFDIGHLRR